MGLFDAAPGELFLALRNESGKWWVGAGLEAAESSSTSELQFFIARFAQKHQSAEAGSSIWGDLPDFALLKPSRSLVWQGTTPLGGTLEAERIFSTDSPEARENWGQAYERALGAIREGHLTKLVLARKASLETNLTPRDVLEKILVSEAQGFLFFVAGGGLAFFGNSPEQLFQTTGQLLRTHALAGTRGRYQDSLSEAENRELLEASEKDIREHNWVRDQIVDQLRTICGAVECAETQVKLAGELLHLETKISGELVADVDLAKIVGVLHPTPATSGFPVRAAVEKIVEIEGFDRGLYAGLVGVSDAEGSQAVVALRSAAIRDGQMELYAGAGLVEGSEEEAEFLETERKLKTVTRLFGKRPTSLEVGL